MEINDNIMRAFRCWSESQCGNITIDNYEAYKEGYQSAWAASYPMPVSVDAIAEKIEINSPYSPIDEYYATVIKAVLDAAGVSHVD